MSLDYTLASSAWCGTTQVNTLTRFFLGRSSLSDGPRKRLESSCLQFGRVFGHHAYYNFLRPHRTLKFGKTLRTPAMQAGLAKRRLSFREVFTTGAAFCLFFLIVVAARCCRFRLQTVSVILWDELSGLNNTCLKKHHLRGDLLKLLPP